MVVFSSWHILTEFHCTVTGSLIFTYLSSNGSLLFNMLAYDSEFEICIRLDGIASPLFLLKPVLISCPDGLFFAL